MINAKGVIQNNRTASEFIHRQRENNDKYPVLDKEEERALIDKYVVIEKDENGVPLVDKTSDEYKDWEKCTDETLRTTLYQLIPNKIRWIKDETEFRKLIVMHNLPVVTEIAAKYCQETVDYDNMYAKGLYGLTIAANKFFPFKKIVKGKGRNRHVVYEDDGVTPQYIKFSTYAWKWVFKYVWNEFGLSSIKIDNNSISLNDPVKIKNTLTHNMTQEDYLNENVSPDYDLPTSIEDRISSLETSKFYDMIRTYVENTNTLSVLEKNIIVEAFYNGKKTKDIADELNISTQVVKMNKDKALSKMKTYLAREYNVHSYTDFMSA